MSSVRNNALLLLLILLGFAGGWFFLWNHFRDDLLYSPEYRLDPERIRIPERPPWVPDSFLGDVLLHASLEQRETVLDPKLPEKLASAFAAHPWVSKVHRVEFFYPAEVLVDLEYCSPCCIVEVPGRYGYPVDSKGVVLPTDYFINAPAEELARYLIVIGVSSNPIGSFGDRWGDKTVEGAARIADLLGKDASSYGIKNIRVLPGRSTGNHTSFLRNPEGIPRFQLLGAQGNTVDWGPSEFNPDSQEQPHPLEKAKKEKLYEYLKQYGTFDRLPPGFSLGD